MGFSLNPASLKPHRPAGQGHWKATLTDEQVEAMRTMHDQGWGYRRLARRFNVARSTVQFICTYRRR